MIGGEDERGGVSTHSSGNRGVFHLVSLSHTHTPDLMMSLDVTLFSGPDETVF